MTNLNDRPTGKQRAIRLDHETNEWIEKRMLETGKTFTNIVKEALLVYRMNLPK